jgi:3-oxoacyl-[acyl-carrier-protein] synthase I
MEKNKRSVMIYQVNDTIISSLGFSSEENYSAVKQGISGLKRYENAFDIQEPIMISRIDENKLNKAFNSIVPSNTHAYTRFEKAAILSAYQALEKTSINPANKNVLFILSTTKGNVELLDITKSKNFEPEGVYLWHSAQLITDFFGNPNDAVVVSNACISGAAAQLYALRELENKDIDFVVVIGADMLSEFVISGFQSFKSLSADICKPFDKNRCGLNLGEAAATIIYGKTDNLETLPENTILLLAGAIANDANHISGPSRTGAGLSIAIEKTLHNFNIQDIAFINAHGTATPYNDDMESMAITANRLEHIPTNSLKGFFGHTLGAAGVVETIISSIALLNNTVLKTNGLEIPETVCSLNVLTSNDACNKTHFLKLLSGFGGCNAALLLRKK